MILTILLAGCADPRSPATSQGVDVPVHGAPLLEPEHEQVDQPRTETVPPPGARPENRSELELSPARNPIENDGAQVNAVPHVIIAIPDTGINPYHDFFHQPWRTAHPCKYIPDYPCSIPALNLTLGSGLSYEAALATDQAEWDAVEPGDVYWIPQTPFIAAACHKAWTDTSATATPGQGSACILEDAISHGVATTAQLLMENPDALIAFVEGGTLGVNVLLEAGIPFDLQSLSWGTMTPGTPNPGISDTYCKQNDVFLTPGLTFVAAGNSGDLATTNCSPSLPHVIGVMGGHVGPNIHDLQSRKGADFTASMRLMLPDYKSTDAVASHFGTSFATPMVAGAASLAILQVRQASGYTGHSDWTTGVLDPIAGLTAADLRHAMNVSATYEPIAPAHQYNVGIGLPVPSEAPYLAWGWGWFDHQVVPRVVACLLDDSCDPVNPDAQAYMDTLAAARMALYRR